MISVYWFVGCVAVLSLALIRVTFVIDRQRKQIPAASHGWVVRTSLGNDGQLRVYVAVGSRSILVATIDPAADDYEPRLIEALADADGRRDTLNALLPEMTP